MKKKLQVTRPEVRKFFNLYVSGRKTHYVGGRKTHSAPEGYIDYYEARSYLLETIEALEKKRADELERVRMEYAQEIEAMVQDEAGASL